MLHCRLELTLCEIQPRTVAGGEVKIDVVELGKGQWFGYTVECHPNYQDALSEMHPTWKVVDLYSAACTLDSVLMPVNVQTYLVELGKRIVAAGGRDVYMKARALELAEAPQDSTVLKEVNAAALASQRIVDRLTDSNPAAQNIASNRNPRKSSSKSNDTTVSPAVPSVRAPKRKASSSPADSGSCESGQVKLLKKRVEVLQLENKALVSEKKSVAKELTKATKALVKAEGEVVAYSMNLKAYETDERKCGSGEFGHRLSIIKGSMYKIMGQSLAGQTLEDFNRACARVDEAFVSE